ncbi:MAG: hypothetical protein ACK5P6_10645 [Pseudobdellovibrionaceae bacterium]
MKKAAVFQTVSLSFLFLALVACGKSKDNQPVMGKAAPTATQPAAPTPKNPSTAVPDSAQNNNTRNQPQAQHGQQQGQAGQSQQSQQTPQQGSAGEGSQQGQQGQRQGQQQGQQAPQMTEDAAQAKINELEMLSKTYTGTANDPVRKFLELRMDDVKDARVKLRNLEAAAIIQDARLKIDYSNGDVAIQLEMKRGNSTRTMILGGTLEGQGQKSTQILAETAGAKVAGTLKCLDAQTDTCEVSHLRLQIGEAGNRATVNIVFRKTNVHLRSQFPTATRSVPEMETLYSIIRHTELNTNTTGKIESAKLETFEVIKGKTGYRFILKALNKEMIMMTGDLKDQRVTAGLGQPAVRAISESDLINANGEVVYKTKLHDSLKDLKLVNNNGYGALSFEVDFNSQVQIEGETKVKFQIERISRPVRQLSEKI